MKRNKLFVIFMTLVLAFALVVPVIAADGTEGDYLHDYTCQDCISCLPFSPPLRFSVRCEDALAKMYSGQRSDVVVPPLIFAYSVESHALMQSTNVLVERHGPVCCGNMSTHWVTIGFMCIDVVPGRLCVAITRIEALQCSWCGTRHQTRTVGRYAGCGRIH